MNTHLQRMSIQGIRSFSPDDPQEIRFLPLTIIIGPNGAGKTTIIESLKYVTSGTMPPNCNSGKSFIHDIHIADASIVRGQIRLAFIDKEKKSTIITRSMQTTLRYVKDKPQISFRQMNAVIKRDGKSIDQKLADINGELLDLLDVPKAILNNVIFCHQEETHWPLSEGKVLKEKFDDIFGSLAFCKALEKIKKLRDEEMVNLRLLEKDVQFSQQIKKEVDSRRMKIMEESAKIDLERKNLGELQSKITSSDFELKDLMEKEQQAEQMSSEIAEIEGSIKEKQRQVLYAEVKYPKLRKMILTKEEVDLKIANFDADLSQMKSVKSNFETKKADVSIECEKLVQEKQKFSSHIAKIEECKNQLAKYFEELRELITMHDLSSKLQNSYQAIDLENFESVEGFRQEFLQFLRTRYEQNEKSNKDSLGSFRQTEMKLSGDLEKLEKEKLKLLYEKETCESEMEKIRKSLKEIEELEKGSSHDLLKTLEAEILNTQKELDQLVCGQKEKNYESEIEKLDTEKKNLEKECRSLNQQISVAEADNQRRIQFEYLNAQKNDKKSRMEEIKGENSDIFLKIQVKDGDFSKNLSALIDQKTRESDVIAANVSDCDKNHFIQSNLLRDKTAQFESKKGQLGQIENKLSGICKLDEFEEFLKKTEQNLFRLREEKSALENVSPLLDQCILSVEKKQICPICEHDVSSEWISKITGMKMDGKKLVTKLTESKKHNPNELAQLNQRLIKEEMLYNQLMLLKNEVLSVKKLKNDISDVELEIQKIHQEMSTLDEKSAIEVSKMNEMKSEIDSLRKCLPVANEYDHLFEHVSLIEKNIDAIGYKESDIETEFEFLKSKLQQKELVLKSCDAKLSDVQKEYMQMANRRIVLQNQLQNAEREKAQFEKKEQNIMLNKQKKQHFIDNLELNRKKLITIEEKFTELAPKIENLVGQVKLSKEKIRSIDQEALRSKHQYDFSIKALDKIIGEIGHYLEELKVSKAKISDSFVEELETRINQLKENEKSFTEQAALITKEIANFELNKRELLDYQNLLNLDSEIDLQREKLKNAKAKIGFMDLSSLRKTRIDAERNRQEMIIKKECSKSRVAEMEQYISQLRSELNQKEYQNAQEKFKEKMVDKVISELACEDLDKYYKALDYAITTFHRNKLESINKLIGEFWKVSYQGTDIEAIEILADEEERSASDRRRSYNYRVVMVSRGKAFDMRGRCSAGQKGLASLIIRMALAILFSNNFTVITLDEPTTNLDTANIQAFAKAIVTLRRINSNVQIVIITHDENFLKYLAADSIDQYYKVFKNPQGYSVIVRQSLDVGEASDTEAQSESAIS